MGFRAKRRAMEKKLLKAGLASRARDKDEISSLREKVQQQQQQIKKLTRALADSEGTTRRDAQREQKPEVSREQPVAALHAEIASLKAEISKLKNSQLNGSLGGVFTRSPTGAADTRAGYATLRECRVVVALITFSSSLIIPRYTRSSLDPQTPCRGEFKDKSYHKTIQMYRA